MKTLPLADARILAPIVTFLVSNGARAESYLDRLRIPGELIESGGMIAKKQCHDILLEIARRERCDEVGFAAYLGFQFDDLGPIGTAMLSAQTVKEALEIFAHLASGLYEGNEYSVKSDGDTTWLCFRDNDHESPGYVHSHHVTMTVYRQMVCLLSDESWRPEHLRCHRHKTDAHLKVDGFEDCTTSVDSVESALAVPTELVSRSLPVHENGATVRATDFQADESSRRDTFVGSLQQLVASRFLYGTLPTLDQVAAIIGISPRTIQRCLQEEGLSYRRLLDRICFDAAREMLLSSPMTIQEIALELGYSGKNNFVRGFRRMTGMTPGEYRRLHLGQ